MNKFISLALVLFASVAIVSAVPYGPSSLPYTSPVATYGQRPSGPAVQQVDISTLSNYNLDPYLSGSAPALNSGSKQVVTGYLPVSNVVAAPAPSAPAYPQSASAYSPAPSPPAYGAPSPPAYGAPSPPAYGVPSYGAPSPKLTAQPAYTSDLYPGQSNYQSYQSPPLYSRVALPIVGADPVAKLFIQQQKQYAPPSPAYGSPY